jgi:hypothetical protein
MLTRVKTTIRNQLTNLLVKLLEQREVKTWFDKSRHIPNDLSNTLRNTELPYADVFYEKPIEQALQPVFITSRFRSGSTLLWNVFRKSGVCTAYYEPFNERKWFLSSSRGGFVDSTHRGVNDYWEEFSGLEHLAQYYQDDWINKHLLMTETHWDHNMNAYIDLMLAEAPMRPVLQFNRIDFRLPWLKKYYSSAKFVHLYRHPRDQWCSFLTDPKAMSADTIEATYEDNFYLDSWCDDLQTYFPFLNKEVTPHPYQRFYYLWKLSYMFGVKYSDISISYESLTRKPKETISTLFEALDMPLNNLEDLAGIISAPADGRWKKYANDNWFSAHEKLCELTLNRWFSK